MSYCLKSVHSDVVQNKVKLVQHLRQPHAKMTLWLFCHLPYCATQQHTAVIYQSK